MDYELYHGDCLEVLQTLNDNSIDMVLVDLPYSMTQQSWDTIIPFPPMWEQVNRVLKPNRAGCFFASQPFTSLLIASNIERFRHEWVWEKGRATGHLNSKYAPMKAHESIVVFSDGLPLYNPQMTHGHDRKVSTHNGKSASVYGGDTGNCYDSTSRLPRSILRFPNVKHKNRFHPNQKPVRLLRYLIRTYTNEGDTVLDFTMGSASSGVASLRECRYFIGIEKGDSYFHIAQNRIQNETGNYQLTHKEKEARKIMLPLGGCYE